MLTTSFPTDILTPMTTPKLSTILIKTSEETFSTGRTTSVMSGLWQQIGTEENGTCHGRTPPMKMLLTASP